jgi:hypothetical protein
MKAGLIQENESVRVDVGYLVLELGSLDGVSLGGYFCLFL